MGISILQHRPVIEMIKERLPVTLQIDSWVCNNLVIAVPGVIAAVKNTAFDYLCKQAPAGDSNPHFGLSCSYMFCL